MPRPESLGGANCGGVREYVWRRDACLSARRHTRLDAHDVHMCLSRHSAGSLCWIHPADTMHTARRRTALSSGEPAGQKRLLGEVASCPWSPRACVPSSRVSCVHRWVQRLVVCYPSGGSDGRTLGVPHECARRSIETGPRDSWRLVGGSYQRHHRLFEPLQRGDI